MATSTYAALNGAEIRRITKARINEEIDKLPYLKLGNAFHRAIMNFGFTMSAHPADVPVPEKEFSFTIDAATANSPEALRQFNKVESLDRQIALMQEQKDKLEDLILEASELRSTLVKESEVEVSIDSSVPDKTRIEHGLDVPVIETKSGKTVETTAPATQFKRVSS